MPIRPHTYVGAKSVNGLVLGARYAVYIRYQAVPPISPITHDVSLQTKTMYIYSGVLTADYSPTYLRWCQIYKPV